MNINLKKMHTAKCLNGRNQEHKAMMFTIASVLFWYYPCHFSHSALPRFYHITSVSGQGNASETTSPRFLVLVSLEWDEAINVHTDNQNIFFCSQHSWVVAP